MKRISIFVFAALLTLSCEKISTQDKLAGSWTEQYDPTVFAMDGSVTYKIVKLTSKEMAWQKEGTTYSQGSWGNDYRHFVRNR